MIQLHVLWDYEVSGDTDVIAQVSPTVMAAIDVWTPEFISRQRYCPAEGNEVVACTS